MNNENPSFAHYFKSLTALLRRYASFLNRAVLTAVVCLFAVSKWVPELSSHFESLTPTLLLLSIGIVIEILLDLQQSSHDPSMQLHESETEAFKYLGDLVSKMNAKNIDMIQFSGQTAIPFLDALAGTRRRVNLRIFLYHPEEAKEFDTDNKENQEQRINVTLMKLEALKESNKKFNYTAMYYRTPPGICGVLLDGKIAFCGWYRCFMDKAVSGNKYAMRVRSHDVPALVARGNEYLNSTLRLHFDTLLKHAEAATRAVPEEQLLA